MGIKWAIFVNWSTTLRTKVCLLDMACSTMKSRVMATQGLDKVLEGTRVLRDLGRGIMRQNQHMTGCREHLGSPEGAGGQMAGTPDGLLIASHGRSTVPLTWGVVPGGTSHHSLSLFSVYDKVNKSI